jgi:hypothetical protein
VNARARRLLGPLAFGAALFAATAYLGAVDPNEPGHYPLCPTKALTGLDCPFCGGLRAMHSLAHLDLVGAVSHNAFVVLVVLPLAVLAWATWLVRAWRGPAPRPPARLAEVLTRPAVMWSLVAVMVAFMVLRNIDSVPALHWLASTSG